MSSPSPSPGRRATSSPSKSPKKRYESPERRGATRYGTINPPEVKFGTEQRFQWQNGDTTDVAYKLPDMIMSRSVLFGYALRQGMDEENPDNKKRSTGPGSYDYSQCYDSLSEYVKKEANRFPCAPRQSMALKTPSPGAVYNIEKQFYLGPEKRDGIGFPNSTRNDLFGGSTTANADMFIPKPETGPAITIAARPKLSKYRSQGTPGAIYDVHVRVSITCAISFLNLWFLCCCTEASGFQNWTIVFLWSRQRKSIQ